MRVRLPPEAAAGAMAASSVCVVLSSLSLRRFRSPHFAADAAQHKPDASA
jgi:cation transport ATPase